MKQHLTKRVLSLLLVLTMVLSLMLPVQAAPENDTTISFTQVDNSAVSVDLLTERAETASDAPAYADTDLVRVSIVLEEDSTVAAGFSTQDIATNAQAMAYRGQLRQQQDAVTASIEKTTGETLDVVWNLTLAANIISANVEYGQIEAIAQVEGVSEVLLETLYSPDVAFKDETSDPNMATSPVQIGSNVAWASGYTGAGTRIAVIDTGTDLNHQAFDEAAYLYSLNYLAGTKGLTLEEYMDSLDLLDAEEIAAVAAELNVEIDAAQAYSSAKAPFIYNYVDSDYDVLHINDMQGEHGSHVAGIAAANAYIHNGDGTFTSAMSSSMVQGVAPDAQLITMKVFGKSGGAYDSDYMVAIEDAVILGADAINLSLGSGNPGPSRNATEMYQQILENLVNCGTVVAMSAGNSGAWANYAETVYGYLYADDVSFQTNGSPGSYTNSLSVASVNNDGTVGPYILVDGQMMIYTESQYRNQPFTTIAGEHEYVFIDGFGTPNEWYRIKDALKGRIAICSRGSTNFADKASYAAYYGAVGTLIYNNTSGVINMDLTDYYFTKPVASLTQADGAAIRAASTPVLDEEGNVLYYTGTMTVSSQMGTAQYNSEYYTMSSFSSWGIPGSLELKPEITAPGGSIYSVYGETPAGGGPDQYETMSGTSMASPQVAGMAAVVAQYIRENGLEEKTGLDNRTLAQSLLMSTAEPIVDGNSGVYYPVIQQGAGLANVGNAVSADSYILMAENATKSWKDGKVKVELGDDPDFTGKYTFTFSLNNLADVEKSFTLSADFFTQEIFSAYASENYSPDEMSNYLDYLAVSLPVSTTWVVDGETLEPSETLVGLDFDGNGTVNTADGQALLDYVVGVRTELQNLDKADLDADADVDTQDAYLFFKALGTSVAVVPAEGEVEITVTVELTEQWDEYLSYTGTGVYVEGYVFAKSLSTDEGVEGTVHSIPVLGYYGNWTDPSMFEVGTYHEFVSGDAYRAAYAGDPLANAFFVSYDRKARTEYYFGGNPLVPDETYLPERNAINSENYSQISSMNFTAIRNAVASKFTAVNKTTGETMMEMNTGEAGAAFYYVNGGYWARTSNALRLGFKPTGAQEGDQLELRLTLAPEYYVDAEGNVDWEALGEGASLTLPMVVDNTAPVLEKVMIDLTNNTLVAVASDNEYVAAVALYNRSGARLHAYTGARMDIEKNETAEYTLDLSQVNGRRFLLQVCDYANNTATYEFEMEIGNPGDLPEMIAFDLDMGHWVAISKDTTYEDLEDPNAAYDISNHIIYAATIVDHIVLAATDEGMLYAMPEDDLADMYPVANLGCIVTDMAYNPADGKVYGVTSESMLISIDKFTGEVTEVGEIRLGWSDRKTNTLACDANGNFYCHTLGFYDVYTFTLDTLENPEYLTYVSDINDDNAYVQSMEINPNTGKLWWTSFYMYDFDGMYWNTPFSKIFEIDPETGNYTEHEDVWHELSALIIPARDGGNPGAWSEPTDKVIGIELSHSDVELLRGNTLELSATVQPWTITDNSVIWKSSDESIATVDEDGMVTAVGVGEAVITATSKLDPSFTASCYVKVVTLNVTIEGLLQDADGNSTFYRWNLETEDTWTAGNPVDTSIASATYNEKDDIYYVMDAVNNIWAMHKMGPDGVTIENSGANGATVPLWDLAFSEYFTEVRGKDQVAGVYNYFLLTPKDPMNLDGMAFDLTGYVGWLAGIAPLGYEEYYDETSGQTYDTEHVVLLGNDGTILNFWLYEDEEGMTAFYNYFPSDLLELDFLGDGTCLYCSLVAGDDGALYLSYFDGLTNHLYRLTFDEAAQMYTSVLVTNMGQGVWPATLTKVTANVPAEENPTSVPKAIGVMEAKPVTAADLAASQLPVNAASVFTLTEEIRNAKLNAQPNSDSTVAPTEETVTLNITTDVAATNGLTTVTYDASKLALETAVISGDYSAKLEENGKLTFGYVAMTEIPAEGTIATLTFKVLSAEDSTVTVEHKQVNNTAGATETLTVEFEHKNTEVRDAIEATCTTAGYSGDTWCLDCGRMIEKGQIIQATGHSYGEWTVAKEATCTEKGEETRTCACGHTETRATDMIGHSYEAVVTEPTCTEMGYTTYTCACGDSYKADYVNPTGHSFGDWETVKEATCTEKGQEKRTCACGETEYRDIDMTAHSYTATVTEPTCTEMGYTTYTCTCGHSYKADYVNPTGHSFGEWTVTKEATCTEKGEETRTCACGATETRATDRIEHSYAQTTVEPDCTNPGYVMDVCSVCGEQNIVEILDPLGHDCTVIVTEPTCTERGYTTYECNRCDHSYIAHMEPATGHSFEAVVTAPTCTEDGYTTHTCHCGETYVDSYVDALGHEWSEWTVSVEADCLNDGEEIRTCAVCGHSYVTDVTDPTGHRFGEWTVTKEATCTEKGEEQRTCACGETETRETAKLPHSYEATVIEPTCTEVGYTIHTCACGESYKTDWTAPKGHSYVTETVEPTCTESGYVKETCDLCGDSHITEVLNPTGHTYETVVTAP
ncbi:MAG: S8 family serine peptidase, partial [Oscillospiraceae bacterium]|nr:S8 family serine peptidase [Oscillospiraceae bacterium]